MKLAWVPPNKERKYNKFNVLGKNIYDQSRMFEFANDNRRIKPRVNC